MDSFRLTQSEDSGFPVVAFTGYCAKEGGEKLLAAIRALLAAGKNHIILDLTGCTLISSPGVAQLLTFSMEIIEDFRGRLFLVGLDNSKIDFLTMTGVIPFGEPVPTVEAALAELTG